MTGKKVFIAASVGLTVLLGSVVYVQTHPNKDHAPLPKNILELRKQAEAKHIKRIQDSVTDRKFLYHGEIFVPVALITDESKKLLDDSGQELYPYKSYDEANGRYYITYIHLSQGNVAPSIKATVPMVDDNGMPVFRDKRGE